MLSHLCSRRLWICFTGAAGTAGGGVGLDNVRERLAALYGGQARLQIEPNTPSGTIVTIEVPYELDATATAPAAA